METVEHMQDRGVSVTVLIGRRKGQASSADLRPETIAACVDRALDIARYTEEDLCNGLADPGRLAVGARDLDAPEVRIGLGDQGTTFGGGPIAAAAISATIDGILAEHLLAWWQERNDPARAGAA